MATAEPTETTLHRTFAAPRERVFRAWTDPEELKRWWGPEGYATPSADVYLRVGGMYRFAMQKIPDGDIFYLTGTYREVRPPERLAYIRGAGRPSRNKARPSPPWSSTTGGFHRGRGDTCAVPEPEGPGDHNRGWSGCLDRLAGIV